jgi:hypothetical protein
MKKIIVTAAVSAIAAVSLAGTASAATPAAACFGQVHKAVNTDSGTQELLGVKNVGQLVQSFENKGQGKNAAAKTFC